MFLKVNNGDLYFESYGQGPPLFMLHGHLLDQRQWDAQFAYFQNSFQVIRYDARGFGDSSAPADPFFHYEDLKSIFDYFYINTGVLLGNSGGGTIALDFALNYPEQVTALILIAPGLPGFRPLSPPDPRLIEMGAAWGNGEIERAVDLSLAALTAGPRRKLSEVDPAAVRRTREMTTKLMRRPRPAREIVQVLDPPLKDRLHEIDVPTLILVGSEDQPYLHEIGQQLEREMPNSRLESLPGCGHHPNLEKPTLFNEKVNRFLSQSM